MEDYGQVVRGGVHFREQTGCKENIRNISTEACICLCQQTPSQKESVEGLVDSVGVVEDFAKLKNLFTGAYDGTAALVEIALEGAFSPDAKTLGRVAYDLQTKNLSQDGFWLFVRVKYEEYAKSVFYQGWEEKFSSWEHWKHDGYDLKGNFQGIEDITVTIIKKAMEWRLKLFAQARK